MNVAHNVWFWDQPATGSGQYVRHLLPALAGLEPGLGLLPVAPRARFKHSRVTDVYKLWFEQIAFPRVAAKHPADVAHVPYFASPLRPAVPTVVTVHDLIPLVLPAYRGSVLVRAYVRLVAAGARRANAIIADSQASKRDVVTRLGIGAERVHVIPLAAGPHFQPAAAADVERVRQRYGLPERYVLYLGGFDRRKNVPAVLKAFARLSQERGRADDTRLVVAGRLPAHDTDFTPDPRRIARALDLTEDVLFPGWIAEAHKPAVYSGATVFVFPSTYEGFGLPVLEAMACGTPVVTSDRSSLPEVVGDAGLTVDPDDVDALAEAISDLLRDGERRQTLRAAGLERASSFSWRRTAQMTCDVYRTVISG